MRISNQQIAAALADVPHVCTPESCPETGGYYVSAVDGPDYWKMAGPYQTHAAALADVDRVMKLTDKYDRSGRAWFMSWGTIRVENGTEPGNLNRAGLLPLADMKSNAETTSQQSQGGERPAIETCAPS